MSTGLIVDILSATFFDQIQIANNLDLRQSRIYVHNTSTLYISKYEINYTFSLLAVFTQTQYLTSLSFLLLRSPSLALSVLGIPLRDAMRC